MRWKLLIITSLVAALLSAGGVRAFLYFTQDWGRAVNEHPALFAGFIAIPLLFGTLATIFVYRHTARRRKLQATLTALFSIILTFAVLVGVQAFLNRNAPGTFKANAATLED